MKKHVTFLMIIVMLTVSGCVSSSIHIAKTDQGYQFLDGDKPILFYQTAVKKTDKGTHSRSNYCHPVYNLDGEIMTEDFPADHLHHRGVFWAWHQVYVADKLIGDMWACTDFIWDIKDVKVLGPGTLQSTVYWRSPQFKDGKEPLAKEKVTICIHEIKDNARAIDFDIEIVALVEGLRIGGSSDVKGYGGFSTRIVLPDDIKMNDANGPVTPRNAAVPAGDWMNFTATFGKEKSGFAILVHPSHPGRPRMWILRAKGSAQNVAWPGNKPVAVSTKEPLILKYRIIFHRGAELDRLFEEYTAN